MAQVSSLAQVIVAPKLQGIWMHSIDNPEGTSANYIFGNTARTESIEIQGTPQRFIGRAHPVYDTGGFETQKLSLEVVVPYGEREQEEVEWFRTAVRSREVICYRDNRSRKHYVILLQMSITDASVGSLISFEATTVDYSEELT